MINLLPPETKKYRLYGRRNYKLLRWCVSAGLGTLAIMLIAAGGYFYISQAEAAAANTKQQLETQIREEEYDKILEDYSTFSNNVRTVVQILNKQVLFSELIQQIGAAIPPGASLNTISISNKDNALSLDFAIINANVAPTLQLNLEDPQNGLFDKADLVQVTCQNESPTTQSCNAQVKVLLKKDASYLFLNSVNKEVQP